MAQTQVSLRLNVGRRGLRITILFTRAAELHSRFINRNVPAGAAALIFLRACLSSANNTIS